MWKVVSSRQTLRTCKPVWVCFKNKESLVMRGQYHFIAGGFAEQETLTFAVRWEESRWRIDLFRILALSDVSLAFPGFSRPS